MEHLGYIPINKLRIEIWSLWISRLVGLFRTKTNSHGAWKGHTWQYPKNTCDCWFIIIRLSYSFRKHNIWLPTMVKWFWPLMIEHDRPIYIYILLQRDMLLEAHPLKKICLPKTVSWAAYCLMNIREWWSLWPRSDDDDDDDDDDVIVIWWIYDCNVLFIHVDGCTWYCIYIYIGTSCENHVQDCARWWGLCKLYIVVMIFAFLLGCVPVLRNSTNPISISDESLGAHTAIAGSILPRQAGASSMKWFVGSTATNGGFLKWGIRKSPLYS